MTHSQPTPNPRPAQRAVPVLNASLPHDSCPVVVAQRALTVPDNARAATIRSSRATRGICFFVVLALSAVLLGATPRPANRPRILGIAAVEIYSTKLDAAGDFFSKALGPADAPEKNCPWRNVASALGHFNFHNFCSEQNVQLIAAPGSAASLLEEVTVSTDNLKAMKNYLIASKISIDNKSDSLAVSDPEGRRIRFIQMPGSGAPPVKEMHLIHAGFIVHDRAATEHFYKDILGFRPYWHGGMKDNQTDWVSLQVPDGTDWLEFMVNVSLDADQRVRGIMNHIAIGVADIHATQKKLLDAGVKLTEEPKVGRDGKWQLNVYDPDLTRVEFMEFKPVEKPCCSEFTGPHPQP